MSDSYRLLLKIIKQIKRETPGSLHLRIPPTLLFYFPVGPVRVNLYLAEMSLRLILEWFFFSLFELPSSESLATVILKNCRYLETAFKSSWSRFPCQAPFPSLCLVGFFFFACSWIPQSFFRVLSKAGYFPPPDRWGGEKKNYVSALPSLLLLICAGIILTFITIALNCWFIFSLWLSLPLLFYLSYMLSSIMYFWCLIIFPWCITLYLTYKIYIYIFSYS